MSLKRIILLVLALSLAGIMIYDVMSKDQPILSHAFQTSIESDHLGKSDYDQYLESFPMERPDSTLHLSVFSLDETVSTGYEIIPGDDYGRDKNLILSHEVGALTFVFDLPESGYYNLALSYYPIAGKSSRIERLVKINDVVPFKASERIAFSRIWVNETNDFKRDSNGNDIIPRQIEAPRWLERTFTDAEGLINGNLLYHFEKGENTITFETLKEPVLIDHVKIYQEKDLASYDAYKTALRDEDDTLTGTEKIVVQGQDMKEKSAPTLYPIADRTSALTTPQDSFALRVNAGGGYNWRVAGDWITYEIDVEKAGFYAISMRARQSFLRGAYVTRQLRINGEIPFDEASEIPFVYSSAWNVYTLGEHEPYLFHFEPGRHEISLEVVLGDFNESIRSVSEVINTLNQSYREIIMITTTQPDLYRDYQLDTRLPSLLDTFDETKTMLEKLSNDLFSMTGESSSQTAILDKVALQLTDFIEQPETIHKRLSEYQNNISALGAWILEIKEQPLTIDYIALHAPEYEIERVNANVFESFIFGIQKFIASFVIDYNSLSSTTDDADLKGTITVWLGTGRDQANIMRRMIDEDFTERYGIGVNLQLVSMDVLLPATLTREGPDVAIGVGNQIPVNYAMRNAVHDIRSFDDYEEIEQRFHPSAIVPYRYLDGVYALPETQLFPVMFYREDILNELGIDIPTTWTEVIDIIPELQRKNLDFFLPIDIVEAVQGVLPPNLMFLTLLYQNGGDLYLDEGRRTGLQEKVALDAFKQWTDFYTNYRFQIQANFVNRFRSGEMPIGISYYNMYNTLVVFAPEISGNWSFTTIPGIEQEDGSIENLSPTTGTGILLMENSREKDLSWAFMKWWTEKDTQVRFGREMEGILGAAARYPTANTKALEELPWPASDIAILKTQWEKTIGIPEVPGGYFTGRHIDNALRQVINTGANPRDTLYEYSSIIDNEIKSKRREFNLD
jgi:ABC-type glycerol-3-phosphate transport system substrate-binding protein